MNRALGLRWNYKTAHVKQVRRTAFSRVVSYVHTAYVIQSSRSERENAAAQWLPGRRHLFPSCVDTVVAHGPNQITASTAIYSYTKTMLRISF